MLEERRKYPRAKVSFPVECSAMLGPHFFYSVSRDLSLAGVQVLTNDFLPKKEALKVNINLINAAVTLKARVVWCNQDRTSSDRYAVGLEFVEVNEEAKRILSSFLDTIFPLSREMYA